MKSIYITLVLLVFSVVTFAQPSILKGKVFDADNKMPLAGASIIVAGKAVAITDTEGGFSIDCNGNFMLSVSLKVTKHTSKK